MGQVVSSKIEQDGLYTITVKSSKDGTITVPNSEKKNLYRYTIPKNIVDKIQTLTLGPIDFNEIQTQKKISHLQQIKMFIGEYPVENVPQICDNYNSSLPSYAYLSIDEKQIRSILFKLYALEQNTDLTEKDAQQEQIPNNYKFNISPCNSVVKKYCKTESLDNFFKSIQSTTGIGSYSSSLVCTTISLCTLSGILSVNFSSNGFNALTIILILCILSSSSTCITNIYNIYKLKNELSK